ncbi:Serpin B4 [Bulinus truncatus]|nr:Serpin B4 [Bulinus truncatus]
MLFLVFFIGIITSCADSAAVRPLEESEELARSVTGFSQELYKRLGVGQLNAIYSPFSCHAALSMVYLGARGSTADEMEATLQVANASNFHLDYQYIFEQLNAVTNIKLLTANALYVNPSMTVNQEYQNDVATLYYAEVDRLDFNAPGGPEAPINSWVANKTQNKITSILQPGTLSQATLAVLINSIFFNGSWSSPFKKENTYKGNFFLSDGSVSAVQVDFMNQIHRYSLKKSDDYDIVRIPFFNRRFAFYVALPKSPSGLPALESHFTADTFNFDTGFLSGFRETFVNLTLPKFSLTATMGLKKLLTSMGMPEAFSSAANFSGITPSSVSISEVLQKALIEVQESGTVAAAVTAIIIERTSANIMPPAPYVFKADHPFCFFLRDDRTKMILFQGKFSSPATKEINIS